MHLDRAVWIEWVKFVARIARRVAELGCDFPVRYVRRRSQFEGVGVVSFESLSKDERADPSPDKM